MGVGTYFLKDTILLLFVVPILLLFIAIFCYFSILAGQNSRPSERQVTMEKDLESSYFKN